MEKLDRRYKSYRFNIRDKILFFNKQIEAPLTRDRLDMIKMLKPCFEYLDEQQISEYQNFSETLKKYGFRAESIRMFIIEFQAFINSQNHNKSISPINWIVLRTIKKSNFEEKNIILNRLAYEYPTEFLFFLQQFIQRYYPSLTCIDVFYKEFKSKVEKLHERKMKKEVKRIILT